MLNPDYERALAAASECSSATDYLSPFVLTDVLSVFQKRGLSAQLVSASDQLNHYEFFVSGEIVVMEAVQAAGDDLVYRAYLISHEGSEFVEFIASEWIEIPAAVRASAKGAAVDILVNPATLIADATQHWLQYWPRAPKSGCAIFLQSIAPNPVSITSTRRRRFLSAARIVDAILCALNLTRRQA